MATTEEGPALKKLALSNGLSLSSLHSSTSSRQSSQKFHSSSQASQESGDESDVEDGQNTSSSIHHHSRKEKSLGILCRRFLVTMGESLKEGTDIHLETVATRMDTEKRRIYDIVNVMEALEAMSKTNKSFYRWNTLAMLPQLMNNLKKEAQQDNLLNKIKIIEGKMCSFTELVTNQSVGAVITDEQSPITFSPLDRKCTGEMRKVNSASMTSSLRDRNGKNSLAQLCRRFLMVLLCNPEDKRRVSLDVASTVLIKEPESEGYDPPSRSRCRRLYDIANVLVAMGLIKKVPYLFGTKKIPLFVYCGPEPCETSTEAQVSMMEFVRKSELAQPNDSTWVAIFGAQSLRPTLANLRSFLPKELPVQERMKVEQPERRILGELDPINPRGQLLNYSAATDHQSIRPFKKRTFDGAFKYPSSAIKTENKENQQPDVGNVSNKQSNENSLPKPQPQNIPSSSRCKESLNTTGIPALPAFVPPLVSAFSPLMPNITPSYHQMYLLGIQWQLRNAFGAQQNIAQAPLLNTSNTAFKPVNNPGSAKSFGGNR